MNNPVSRDAIIRLWPIFSANVKDRLAVGAEQYGDSSFKKMPSDLLKELEQEALDIAGWGFILWVRIHNLAEKVKEESL
jgi:hypothetical protein